MDVSPRRSETCVPGGLCWFLYTILGNSHNSVTSDRMLHSLISSVLSLTVNNLTYAAFVDEFREFRHFSAPFPVSSC